MSSVATATTTSDQKMRGRVSVTCELCGKEHQVKASQARRARFKGRHAECYLNRKLKGKKREVLPDYGSIVDWPNHKGELVPVKCGVCKKWDEVRASEARRSGYKGLHAKCYQKIRKHTGSVKIGKEGSIFHHDMPDPADPSKRGITCGRCKKIWYSSPRYGKALLEFPGICPTCKPRQHAGEVILPKGTKVFFDLDKRERQGGTTSTDKVIIECRGCFKETGKLKKVWLSQVTRYMRGQDTWDELCGECVRKRGPLDKLNTDKIAPSGTITQFGRENEKGEVPIIYKLCGCERWTAKQNGISNWKKWVDTCPAHQRDRAGLHALLIEQTSHNLENGNGKKHSGPEKGYNAIITEAALTEAFGNVQGYPTQEKIAELIGVAARSIREWQQQNGTSWSQVKQRFINRR